MGCGSAPSDPRRNYYIGNLGIRKPEKIRKIGNAWFAHPITNYSVAIYNHPANYNWQERNKRTNRHGESITASRQGVAFKAGSPLQKPIPHPVSIWKMLRQ
jgi:hypothetical protein